jgi:hypothetical protein
VDEVEQHPDEGADDYGLKEEHVRLLVFATISSFAAGVAHEE